MSSWITNGLKTLRIRVGSAVGSVSQQRSPPYLGVQAKQVEIPPKPKRPLTPYFRFMGQVREEVHRQNPTLKSKEVLRIIAQRWEALDEAQKQPYLNAYKGDMENFSTIYEKYKQSLTPQQIQAQEQQRLEKRLVKEKRDRKKRLKELGKPKKPGSPFFLYMTSKVPKGERLEEYQKAAKLYAQAWKAMSDAEKAPYISKYNEEVKKYEQVLQAWEDKMLKQGHEDLVRLARKPQPPSPPTKKKKK